MENVSLVDLVGKVLQSGTVEVTMPKDTHDMIIKADLNGKPVSINISAYVPDNLINLANSMMMCGASCSVTFGATRVYYTSGLDTTKLYNIVQKVSSFMDIQEKETAERIHISFEKVIGGSFIG